MANSDKNIRITTSKNKTTYPNIVFTGSAAGSSVITLEVLDDNTLSFTSNEGQVFSIDSNLSTGTIWAVSDISGIPLLSASAGGTIGLGVYGGTIAIGQTNPTYKLDLKGSFGLASANDGLYNFIFSNSAVSGSNSLQIRSANSLLLYNSGNTFYTGLKSNAAASVTYTLPTTDGSSGQFLQTNGTGALTWATATGSGGTGSTAGVGQGGQYEMAYYPGTGLSVVGSNTFKNNTVTGVVSITHTTASTSFSNGALTVSGGVGIGGSLFVGGIGASISGVSFSNSIINRGTWNATVIATQYGGTGQNLSSSSGVLTISSGTVSASTTSSAISSAISDKTGSGALTFATNPVLVNPNIGAATGTSLYLSAFSPSSSTTTGALIVPGGVGIGGSTYIGGMLRVGTDTFTKSYSQGDVLLDNGTTDSPAVRYYWANNKNFGTDVFSVGVGSTRYRIVRDINETGGIELFSVDTTGAIQIYNGSSYSGFRYSGSGQTIYTLPSTSPATGSSVLQSTSEGVMSWVPMVAASSSGAGSGTVAIPDAQYRIAYYAGTGASVSSTNLITAVGTGVTILGLTNASSTTVAALSILGGLGITGNAFIGGTTVITSTSTSISTTSGALTVAGGVGIGGSLFTGTSTASSISGVVLNNGVITSGTWAATAITALYGGTGFNSYLVGDLLVASTGTSLAKLAANSNVGYVLTSTGANSVPTWQSVPPSAASTVAVRETVLSQPFYPTFVSSSSGTGLGLSTVATMFINPLTGFLSATGFSAGIAVTIQGSSPAVSTSSGALVVVGGVGIGGSLFVASPSRFSSSTDSASTGTGAVVISGGLGLAGNAFIGGTANITNSTVSTSAISGALTVSGGVGIGGSLYVGGIGASITGVTFSNSTITRGSWNATVIAPQYGGTGLNNSSATGLLQYSSGTASVITTSSALSTIISDITGTAGKLVFSTSPTFTTSVATDSAILAVFNTTATTVNAFGAASAISLGAASGTVTVNSINNALSTSTGALVVTGGVGIGKSASIAGSLLLFNGSNYSGFRYTGTAITTYTLPADSPKSSVGTSVLTSTVDGIMSWVGMSAGGSASAAGSNQQIQYNNGGNFGGATGMTWNDGSNLLTLSATSTLASSATQAALRIINNNNTDPTSNIRWSPALELVGRSGVTPGFGSTYNNRFTSEVVPQGPSNYGAYLRTKYSYDLITGSPSFANDLFRIHSTLGVGFGASNSTSNAISYFRISTTQSGDVSYILPPGLPSTGTSVLQSDTSGNLLWVNMAGGPGGSGTVNSGTAGSVAFYNTTGTTVSGSSALQIATSGTAISVFTNFDLRSQNKIRFFNSGNTFRTELHAGSNTVNYALALPTAPVGAGASVIVTGSDGLQYFAAPGSGIAFSAATANTPLIRAKRHLNLLFTSGFTPLAAGADTAIIRVPESPTDGTTVLTYNLERFQVRVETPSAGSSRLQLERSSTDTGAFTLAAAGSSHIGGFGVTITGAGIYLTSVTSFAGSFVTSGNLLRLNWTLLNATHANFSVNLILEEV